MSHLDRMQTPRRFCVLSVTANIPFHRALARSTGRITPANLVSGLKLLAFMAETVEDKRPRGA